MRSVPGRVRVWVTGIVLTAWEFRASGSRRMQSHPVLGDSEPGMRYWISGVRVTALVAAVPNIICRPEALMSRKRWM